MKRTSMKLLSVVLTLAMAVSMLSLFAVSAAGTTPDVTYGAAWDGQTKDTEWQVSGNYTLITSAAELAGLASQVTLGNTYAGTTFLIIANIDLGGHEWAPIGSPSAPFSGTLMGALGGQANSAVCIKGLKIEAATSPNVGLISTMVDGGIQDITLVEPSIKVGQENVGFFVGLSKIDVVSATSQDDFVVTDGADFTNLKIVGGQMTITATQKHMGGVVGQVQGDSDFTNCDVEWNITAEADNVEFVGGVAGKALGACNFTGCDSVFSTNKDITNVRDLYILLKVAGIAAGGPNSVPYEIAGVAEPINLVANTVAKLTNCTADIDFYNCNAGSGEILLSGIWGYRSTSGHSEIDGCVSTGTIRVAQAGASTGIGGLVGTATVQGDILKNSASNVDIIIESTAADAVRQIGGLIANVKKASIITVENCYYGGYMDTKACRRVAGIVGFLEGQFTGKNIQFDGIIDSPSTQNGLFIGRYNVTMSEDKTTTFSTVNLENCLVTGVAGGNRSGAFEPFWLGLVANHLTTWTLTFTNCYSAYETKFAGRNDYAAADAAGSTGPQTGTMIIDGVTYGPTQASNAYSWFQYKANTIPADLATMNGFDFTNTWVKSEDYAYPVLKVAIDTGVVGDYVAGDLSWFDPNNSSSFTISNDAQLIGLAKVTHLSFARANFVMKVEDNKMTKLPDLSLFNEDWLGTKESNPVHAIVMLNTKFQIKDGTTATSDTATIRLVSSVGKLTARKYAKVGFKVTVDGVAIANQPSTTSVYTSILGGGTTYDATIIKDDSMFLFVGDIEVAKADYNKTITIQAYYELTNGTVVYGAPKTGTVADIIAACTPAAQ